MPSTSTSTRRVVSVMAQMALAVAAFVALPSVSSAQVDSGYAQYRCAVLNEAAACPAPSITPASETKIEIVAGPYASYLMHLGQDSETAIETARARGEVATQRTVLVRTRQLSAAELHERHLGRLATSATTYEILAEAPVEAPVEQARVESSQAGAL